MAVPARGPISDQHSSPRESPTALGSAPPAFILPSFRELYAMHFAFTWRSLRYLGVDSQQLDDAVQEVWVVAHRRLADFRGQSDIKTWLFGIALNVQRNLYRAQRRHASQVPLSEGLRCGSPDPLLEREGREAWTLVMRFLKTLDAERRAVFVSSLLEGLLPDETAKVCGLDVPTVYLRVRALRRAFRLFATAQRGEG